jgi:hypothetical protein
MAADIAETCRPLHRPPRDGWTFGVDLRPWPERC